MVADQMLATEALAADRESKTAKGVSGQLTTIDPSL